MKSYNVKHIKFTHNFANIRISLKITLFYSIKTLIEFIEIETWSVVLSDVHLFTKNKLLWKAVDGDLVQKGTIIYTLNHMQPKN